SYYSFDYGSTHFIVLDDIDWIFNQQRKRFGYRGGFGEEQLEFVRNDLAMIPKDQFVCMMMHIPIVGVTDRAQLYELIRDRPLTISISGHTHHHEHLFLSKKDGFNGARPHHHIINVTVSGSWWSGKSDERGIPHSTMADGAPNGYSILTFDGKNYQVEFRAAGRSADYQMRIVVDEVIPASKLAEETVHVNIFNGSEKSKVEIRFDGQGPWMPMEKARGFDPAFVRMFQEDRAMKEKANPNLSGPKNCPHLWKSGLPEKLAPGVHLVTIRTTDMHGKVHEGQKVFRVGR
ncbi:MAG: calcineurin-like phosphoesterase C-terminal domain-containing protein, partial [Planctomycetota bacterium]|nr:calcineurin-like phosphoesterase C-terminal domain-containing protein [Planctomycetota bacterium]